MRRDLVFGGVMLAISAAYVWLAGAIPSSQLADQIGPQGLPRIYAGLLAALSVILMVRGIRGWNRDRDPGPGGRDPEGSEVRRGAASGSRTPDPGSRSRLLRAAGMLGIGMAYLAVAPWLGYLLAISGVILATAYYQGGSISRQSVAVAVGGGILFWVLFVVLMGIAQPPGWFPPTS